MLEALFGNRTVERVLFYLHLRGEGYATGMARQWGCALSPVQKALDRLERGGIVAARRVGRTRLYTFEPRHPFLPELKALLERACAALPDEIRRREYEPRDRSRPRRRGKA